VIRTDLIPRSCGIQKIRHVFDLSEARRERQPETILQFDNDVRITPIETGPASSYQA
jgi:hypothetical protein